MEVIISAADKRKSLVITTIIYFCILLILFFIRFWPPANMQELAGGGGGGGVTVNFGDVEAGSGNNFKSEVLEVKNQTKQVVKPIETVEEQIIAQENSTEENDVVIAKKPITKKPKVIIDKKIDTKPVIVKPKVNKNTNDALANILKGGNKGGDGNTASQGNQGTANGNLSNDGYGLGGSGGGKGGGKGSGNGMGTGPGSGLGSGGGSGSGVGKGSGYFLGDRKALSKPKPNSECSNEVGNVVVEITVDQNGKVVKAISGVKGTTITASCLKEQARQAALNTKWQPKEDAPESQVGKIIYSFSLN